MRPRGTIEEITEPQGLSVVPARVAGRDTAALRLTWGHPSSGTPDRYRLRYGRPGVDPEGVPSPPSTSVILPGSSLSYVINGLQFDTDYQIWLRAESEDARPDCEEERGHVEECGPWAKTSGNTGGKNREPVAVEDLEAIVLEVGHTQDVDVAHYFSDPDGDELAFSAFSQNGGVATVAPSGGPSSFTITAVSAGKAIVSVSATDPGGLSARAGIEVTVQEGPLPLGPPLMVTPSWSGTALTVRWREPENSEDFEIQHYSVRLARADWVSDPQEVTPDRPLEAVFDDREIWPGCMYAITVRAHATTDASNALIMLEGDPAKIEFMPGQPPCAKREVPSGAPRSLHVTRDAGPAITVVWDAWSPPVDPVGVSVVYALEVADPDETVVQSLADLGGPAHTVTDLELYVDYRFRIRAGFRYNQTEPVQYGPWSPRARRYSEDARLEVEIGDDQEFEYAIEYDTLGFSVRLSGETPRPVSVRLEVFQNGSREPVDVSAGQPFYGLSSGNGGRLDFLPGLARDPWIYADFHEGLEPTDQILIVLSEPDPPGFLRLGDRSRLQCTGAGVCGATPVPTLAPAGALILAAILAGFGWRRTRGCWA